MLNLILWIAGIFTGGLLLGTGLFFLWEFLKKKIEIRKEIKRLEQEELEKVKKEEEEKRKQEELNRERRRNKQKFVEECQNRISSIRQQINVLLETQGKTLQSQREISSKMNDLSCSRRIYQTLVDHFSIHETNIQEKAAADFDMLMNLDEVDSVSFDSEEIAVITKPLQIIQGSINYNIGIVKIAIQLNTGEIKITGPMGYKINHPHVDSEGHMVMDHSLRISLLELIASYDFSNVFQIVLEALQYYEPKNALFKI